MIFQETVAELSLCLVQEDVSHSQYQAAFVCSVQDTKLAFHYIVIFELGFDIQYLNLLPTLEVHSLLLSGESNRPLPFNPNDRSPDCKYRNENITAIRDCVT